MSQAKMQGNQWTFIDQALVSNISNEIWETTPFVVLNKNVQVSTVLMVKLYSENAILVLSNAVTQARIYLDKLVGLEFHRENHIAHTCRNTNIVTKWNNSVYLIVFI
jgi:hypothetical protein